MKRPGLDQCSTTAGVLLISLTTIVLANERPFADAGMPVYAGADPVYLDGSGSYDPDASGPLQNTWQQVSGPELTIEDPTDAMPRISGPPRISSRGLPLAGDMPQTDEIQVCEFALTVSDGELESSPDYVRVVIVPKLGVSELTLENAPFDSDKPTVIYFGGGDCWTGFGPWGRWEAPDWYECANMISFVGYYPDNDGEASGYVQCADLLMVFLSRVAPEYRRPIQAIGYSTGGQPAIDFGIRSNLTYRDPRYAVNRVTLLDATPYCRGSYADSIATFLASAVEGEQCWVDNYVGTLLGVHGEVQYDGFQSSVLGVGYALSHDHTLTEITMHRTVPQWYANSLVNPDMSRFNGGLVGGAFWSVLGKGKNLQLASSPGAEIYKFQWAGDAQSGTMAFHDETLHPGRLPEPVTLVGPVDVGDPNGVVFTCEPSENAVGYELLFGSDPYRMADYIVVSDTPGPPDGVVGTLPFSETWWTVRARDAFGSTIYADPIPVNLEKVPMATIERMRAESQE